ncbi:type III-B CRISPR-associated protein Cas10/Cmr2 [Anditalea andensis]|nr:type III-B CRISPR-associated protein Cas10/Cmr2 [Anditalea andensis]
MTNSKKYIALTLGPIYRTLMLAKSSKELWAASYLFSYLGKQLIKEFRDRKFILPYVNDRMFEPASGAGLFPDRYIFEAQEGDFDDLVKKIDNVIEQLADNITCNGSNKKECIIFLKNYLKIYFLEFEHEDTSTLVESCNRQLSILELQDNFNPKEQNNFLSNFFGNINGKSFLANDSFGDTISEDNRLFESLIELAIPEHRTFVSEEVKKGGNNDEERVLDQLKAEKKFRSYHSYVAIVKADGDNVGKTISDLQKKGKPVIDLAKQLFELNLNVVKIVDEYKGRAIYVGGDDLLIFAPLLSEKGHLFAMVEQINLAFEEVIHSFEVKPTLSFGISIIHYKSPMFEALERTEDLLTNKAKRQFNKNAIAFSLDKRSGHHIEAIIPKGQCCIYNPFKDMIDTFLNKSDIKEEKGKLLSSVMHWLGRNKEMLRIILSEQESKRTIRLENYFANSFNEKIHESNQNFLNKVQQFLLNTYAHSNSIETTIQTVYATLRFIHFLNSDKDE